MSDDASLKGFGPRDARGEWRPAGGLEPPPIFVWPPRPMAFLRWLAGFDGYILPWNLFYLVLATVTWLYLTPELSRMTTFRVEWMAEVYFRNLAILGVFGGLLHLRLYILKGQGDRYKYSSRWPKPNDKTFLFKRQVFDNVFWSLASGCTVWSAYDIVMMWGYANHLLPYVDWAENPFYFLLLLLAIPVWGVFHFYWIHRFIHWKPIYDRVHYLHHKNVNIGPWSGLAMHPVEHLIYFSSVLIHLVVPSHPLHIIFHLQQTGLNPIHGHSGFDEFVVAGGKTIPNHNYFHYLHHRYHTVNFGDGLVPLDKWFGSFHDGTDEAHAAMRGKPATKETS